MREIPQCVLFRTISLPSSPNRRMSAQYQRPLARSLAESRCGPFQYRDHSIWAPILASPQHVVMRSRKCVASEGVTTTHQVSHHGHCPTGPLTPPSGQAGTNLAPVRKQRMLCERASSAAGSSTLSTCDVRLPSMPVD
jgi:hypothetical protein